MLKKVVLIFFMLIVMISCQANSLQFVNECIVDNMSYYFRSDIIFFEDGGYIICGTDKMKNNHLRLHVLKLASDFSLEWDYKALDKERTYGGHIFKKSDDKIIIKGGIRIRGDINSLFIELNKKGKIIKRKIMNKSYSLLEMLSNGNYLARVLKNDSKTKRNVSYLVKVSKNLIPEWEIKFGTKLFPNLRKIMKHSKNIFLWGYYKNSRMSIYKGVISKLSKNGELIWEKFIDNKILKVSNNSLIIANNMVNDSKGNILLQGKIIFLKNKKKRKSRDEIFIVKLNSSGKVIWKTIWNSHAFLGKVKIIKSQNDDLIVAVQVLKRKKFKLLKFSSKGEVIWEKEIIPSNGKKINDIFMDDNGDYIVVGSKLMKHKGMFTERKFWIAKYRDSSK